MFKLHDFIRTPNCSVGKQITITIELSLFLFSGKLDACKGFAQFDTVIRTNLTHLPNSQIFSTERLAPNASGFSIFFRMKKTMPLILLFLLFE